MVRFECAASQSRLVTNLGTAGSAPCYDTASITMPVLACSTPAASPVPRTQSVTVCLPKALLPWSSPGRRISEIAQKGV